MSFEDTYTGLDNIWYEFSSDGKGNVELWANADGYEHLARYFLKLARGRKQSGYHSHHAREFGGEHDYEAELTIGIADAPQEHTTSAASKPIHSRAMLSSAERTTTQPGYVNRNRQTVVRATGLPGNDHLQRIYVLKCGDCGAEYGANGSDIFQRKCPSCQGGADGLPC